jgi:hypothetical protein
MKNKEGRGENISDQNNKLVREEHNKSNQIQTNEDDMLVAKNARSSTGQQRAETVLPVL